MPGSSLLMTDYKGSSLLLKGSLPWGQVPVLDYNGQVLCQSLSIARFLAAEFGLVGNTNLERAQANEVVDAVADLQNAMIKVAFGGDEKGVDNVLDNVYPAGLANLEKVLVRRGGQFFVGNNLTWADLAVFQFVSDGVAGKAPKDVSAFPCIANLCKRVGNIPNIKNWMTVSPVTAL